MCMSQRGGRERDFWREGLAASSQRMGRDDMPLWNLVYPFAPVLDYCDPEAMSMRCMAGAC